MAIKSKALQWAMLAIIVGGLSVACGSEVSEGSQGSSDQSSNASTQYNSPSSAEDPSNAADTLGNLILLRHDHVDAGAGFAKALTFVDTETGQSDSRSFTFPEGGEMNPSGNSGSRQLPFNEDLTKLAVVSDEQDGYYRSAGYIAADGGYTEVARSQSSFEGESGYYAATFHNGQLWVMNRNQEWIDPASGEVRDGPPIDDDTGGIPDLYISGSENLRGYGVGECSYYGGIPSQVTSKCYSRFNEDIEFYSNETIVNDRMATSDDRYATVEYTTIEVEDGDCDSLLALDSEDNFYCLEVLNNGQQQLIRVDVSTRIGISTGKAHAITPATDQEILQAIVSTNDEQVLFTARRGDDPITAYAAAAAGGTEPRELSALTGQLSEGQELYNWTASNDYTGSEELTNVKDEPENQPGQVWSGQITAGNDEDSTSEYSLEATIVPIPEMTKDLVGEIVGKASYKSLNCSGLWVLEEVNENTVVVEEQIWSRDAGVCLDSGFVTLTLQGDEALEYRWVEKENNDNVDAGSLTRQVNAAPETTSAEPADPETTETTSTESSLNEDPAEEVEEAVRGHYEAIGEADFEEAYSYFGPTYTDENSEDEWIAEEESYEIEGSTIESVDVEEVSGEEAAATVVVGFEDNTGTPRFEISWKLAREGGEWKLDEVTDSESLG